MAPIDELSVGGAPVLGGRHSRGKRDNQPNDGVGGGGSFGEAMRTGGTRGGGCLPIVLGGELRDKKMKIERAMGPRISMAPAA